MTDDELNALVETLDYAATCDTVDWHLTHLSIGDARAAASAIRQLMRERDEAKGVMRTSTDTLSFAPIYAFFSKHPPAQF